MKIGCLGPAGSFSEAALDRYASQQSISIEKVFRPSFNDLFDLVSSNEVDAIIIAIENSTEGEVSINLDLIARSTGVFVNHEMYVDIQHCLLAKADTQLSDIRDIYSHPQPLAQCSEFLRDTFPDVQCHPTSSTSVAAQIVADSTDCSKAVIGSDRLSGVYRLNVLKPNVNDFENNVTRFWVLGRNQVPPSGSDKTSLIFATQHDQPGSLYEVLKEFKEAKINMTRISSRPVKAEIGEYLFYIDCEGHQSDQPVQDALNKVETKTSYFKLLGSYPRGER